MDIYNYIDNGFLIGEPILSNSEILEIRELLDKYYINLGDNSEMLLNDNNDYLHNKLINLLKTKSISNFFDSLEKTTGEEISVLPPFLVMRNYFPHPYLLNGWHSDCGGELKRKYCKDKLEKSNYIFGKIGIYLQLNGDAGGAIDVIPKSHTIIRRYNTLHRHLATWRVLSYKILHLFSPSLFKFIPEKYVHKFLKCETLRPLISSPVFFDSGIIHKGTSPNRSIIKNLVFEKNLIQIKNTPKNLTKYAIYFQFGNQIGIKSYMHDRLKRSPSGQCSGDESKIWKAQTNFLIKNNYIKGSKMKNIINQANSSVA